MVGERNGFSKPNKNLKKSIGQCLSKFNLFLFGDVQVLEAGIEQQVLVDLVPRDFAKCSPIHLRMGRQMHLQHLQ